MSQNAEEATKGAEGLLDAVDRYFPAVAVETSFEEGDLQLLERVLQRNPSIRVFWKGSGGAAARERAEFVRAKYYVTPLRSSPIDWGLKALITTEGGRLQMREVRR